jgi:hypothetical protein
VAVNPEQFSNRIERAAMKAIVTVLTNARQRVEALDPVLTLTTHNELVDKRQVTRILQEFIDESVKFV